MRSTTQPQKQTLTKDSNQSLGELNLDQKEKTTLQLKPRPKVMHKSIKQRRATSGKL